MLLTGAAESWIAFRKNGSPNYCWKVGKKYNYVFDKPGCRSRRSSLIANKASVPPSSNTSAGLDWSGVMIVELCARKTAEFMLVL